MQQINIGFATFHTILKGRRLPVKRLVKILATTFFFVCLQVIFEHHIKTSKALFKPKKGFFSWAFLFGYLKFMC